MPPKRLPPTLHSAASVQLQREVDTGTGRQSVLTRKSVASPGARRINENPSSSNSARRNSAVIVRSDLLLATRSRAQHEAAHYVVAQRTNLAYDRFQVVTECMLSMTELNDGLDGGGGIRVSPLSLIRMGVVTRRESLGVVETLSRLSERMGEAASRLSDRLSGAATRLSDRMSGVASSVSTTVRRGSLAILGAQRKSTT